MNNNNKSGSVTDPTEYIVIISCTVAIKVNTAITPNITFSIFFIIINNIRSLK